MNSGGFGNNDRMMNRGGGGGGPGPRNNRNFRDRPYPDNWFDGSGWRGNNRNNSGNNSFGNDNFGGNNTFNNDNFGDLTKFAEKMLKTSQGGFSLDRKWNNSNNDNMRGSGGPGSGSFIGNNAFGGSTFGGGNNTGNNFNRENNFSRDNDFGNDRGNFNNPMNSNSNNNMGNNINNGRFLVHLRGELLLLISLALNINELIDRNAIRLRRDGSSSILCAIEAH